MNYFLDLFIEEWLTEVNYSRYFNECSPLSCSYTITDQRNISYALTMFISDFIINEWLLILQQLSDYNGEDWRNRAYPQFQLLSNLCKLTQNTIDDAIQLDQYFMGKRKTSWSATLDNLLTSNNQSLQVVFNSFGTRYVKDGGV
ncbi:hypothetical protein I4U23_005295 [Adineta vaga]|nr:hypothetical protein I4U23_005295 [Adineta vaga]